MAPKRKRNDQAEQERDTVAPPARATRSSTRSKDATQAATALPKAVASNKKKATTSTATSKKAPNLMRVIGSSEHANNVVQTIDDGTAGKDNANKDKGIKANADEDDGKSSRIKVKQSSELLLEREGQLPQKISKTPTSTSKRRSDDTQTARKRDDEAAAGPSKSAVEAVSKAIPPASADPPKPHTYSPSRAQALFETYADADNSEVIGPEGLERLCEDAEIPMDGALPLLQAWLLDAKDMAKLTREEWMKGMNDLKIDSLPVLVMALSDLQDLLVYHKTPPKRTVSSASSTHSKSGKQAQSRKSSSASLELYNKNRLQAYAADVNSAFAKLYTFCFTLAKTEQSRNIDIEIASAFWSVILAPQYPIMSEIIAFIAEKDTYRAVNKDLWTMTYEFCKVVDPSLEDYDSDGAWPTLLDDFVTWKKAKMNPGSMEKQESG